MTHYERPVRDSERRQAFRAASQQRAGICSRDSEVRQDFLLTCKTSERLTDAERVLMTTRAHDVVPTLLHHKVSPEAQGRSCEGQTESGMSVPFCVENVI